MILGWQIDHINGDSLGGLLSYQSGARFMPALGEKPKRKKRKAHKFIWNNKLMSISAIAEAEGLNAWVLYKAVDKTKTSQRPKGSVKLAMQIIRERQAESMEK